MTKYDKQGFSKRLKEVRQYCNDSQEEFGEKIGAVRNRISKIERGDFESMNLLELNKLIEIGFSVDWLVSGQGSKFVSENIDKARDFQEAFKAQNKLLKCMEEKGELLRQIIEMQKREDEKSP